MIDDKSEEAQLHKIQKIANDIICDCMVLDEQFQIVVIIDKLLPGCKDFKNMLKYKTKKFSLKNLIVCFRIEVEARK